MPNKHHRGRVASRVGQGQFGVARHQRAGLATSDKKRCHVKEAAACLRIVSERQQRRGKDSDTAWFLRAPRQLNAVSAQPSHHKAMFR